MTEALQIMGDYTTFSERKENALKKDIYTFINKYKSIIEWVIEHTKKGLRTDWYIQELRDIDDSSFYKFIRKLVSLKFKLKTFRRIMFTFKSTNPSTFDKYLLTNLRKTPYDFINIEYQLITFEKAEILNTEYNLNIGLGIRTNAWVYDLFLKGGRLYEDRMNRKIKRNKKTPSFYLPIAIVQEQYCLYLKKNNIIKKCKMTKKILQKLKKSVIRYKNNKEYYTTEEFMNLEKELGENILDLYLGDDIELAVSGDDYDDAQIAEHTEKYEEQRGFKFTQSQKRAIKNGIQKNFSIITGYPGAGKTTVCDCIINFLQKAAKEKNICLISPTGLAVKNLRDNCKSHNKNENLIGTNHRMIYNIFDKIYKEGQGVQYQQYIYFGESEYENDADNYNENHKSNMPSHIHLMIMDEASMVDIFIFKRIIKYCKIFRCRLLLVGDVNQLPPINYGAPFEWLIESEIFEENTTELKEIKRNNGILSRNIIKLNEERLMIEDFDNDKMIFQDESDFSDENLSKILTKIKQDNQGKRIHFMASQKTQSGGVDKLNMILQDIYNFEAQVLIPGRYDEYRENDKIIRTENDYSKSKMRVNGDRALLVKDNKCKGSQVCVQYDDDGGREMMSIRDFWDNFKLFYASTVHKMQGSETDIIVLVIPNAHKFMWSMTPDSKRLLYTAISRCKERCIIIGSRDLFNKAQESKQIVPITLFMKEFISDWDFGGSDNH